MEIKLVLDGLSEKYSLHEKLTQFVFQNLGLRPKQIYDLLFSLTLLPLHLEVASDSVYVQDIGKLEADQL